MENCRCDDASMGARKLGGAWHHNDSAMQSVFDGQSLKARRTTYRLLSAFEGAKANAMPL